MSLQTRIEEKRKELEALVQVKDLSEGLVANLEQLESKLDTLSDGTEGESGLI